jgi:hypothetical protein
MSASLLVPKDGEQGASREPLSVMVLHQDDAALERAKAFYAMMEQEFGDDFCFDCVYWPEHALATNARAVLQDASEADLVLLAVGEKKPSPFLKEVTAWLRSVRNARHSAFSLVCLTDDPALGNGRIHSDLQHLAGHFSMVYLAPTAREKRSKSGRASVSAVSVAPVPFNHLVDPRPEGGIND